MEEQKTPVPEEAPKTKRAYKQRLSKTDAEKAMTLMDSNMLHLDRSAAGVCR